MKMQQEFLERSNMYTELHVGNEWDQEQVRSHDVPVGWESSVRLWRMQVGEAWRDGRAPDVKVIMSLNKYMSRWCSGKKNTSKVKFMWLKRTQKKDTKWVMWPYYKISHATERRAHNIGVKASLPALAAKVKEACHRRRLLLTEMNKPDWKNARIKGGKATAAVRSAEYVEPKVWGDGTM